MDDEKTAVLTINNTEGLHVGDPITINGIRLVVVKVFSNGHDVLVKAGKR